MFLRNTDIYQRVYGAKPQKIIIFTAVKTLNLTREWMFLHKTTVKTAGPIVIFRRLLVTQKLFAEFLCSL